MLHSVSCIDMQHHDFVVVGATYRCTCADFIVEDGDYGTVPDLNKCPFFAPSVGHGSTRKRGVGGLPWCR